MGLTEACPMQTWTSSAQQTHSCWTSHRLTGALAASSFTTPRPQQRLTKTSTKLQPQTFAEVHAGLGSTRCSKKNLPGVGS